MLKIILSDSSVVFIQKLIQALIGFFTSILVVNFLTPSEQGFYYALGSLLTFCLFFDFGLNSLLVQISARMSSNLVIGLNGRLSPNCSAKDKYIAMAFAAKNFYKILSFLIPLLIPLGFLYFYFSGLSDTSWEYPLVIGILSTSIYFRFQYFPFLLEGVGRMREIYFLRIFINLISAVFVYYLMLNGYGLFVQTVPFLVAAILFGIWSTKYYSDFMEKKSAHTLFKWSNDVWPLQREGIISSLATFIFQNSPVLIVFYLSDPVSSGKLGLSCVVANVVGAICSASFTASIPVITKLISNKQYEIAKSMFFVKYIRTIILISLSYSLICIILSIYENDAIVQRVLPVYEFIYLFISYLIFHSVGMFSCYFRAFGKELLVKAFFVSSISSCVISIFVHINYKYSYNLIFVFMFLHLLICTPAIVFHWLSQKDIFKI